MANEVFVPDFSKRGGLVPAVVQDFASSQVLMLGWMNLQAWKLTFETKKATFWSTSRDEIWVKGATSGDGLTVRGIRVDCDDDTILLLVEPDGIGTCHTRNASGQTRVSCFYRSLDDAGELIDLDP